MVVRIVIAMIVVGEYELYALLCEIASLMCITYLLDSIFFTSFCKSVKWGSGKVCVFDNQSENSQRLLIHVLGMNPVVAIS